MAVPPRDVTDTEQAILAVLWERGAATRPEITDALYPGGGAAQYATVQKLLARLEAKGYVSHKRTGNRLSFRATLRREDFIGRRLQDLADKLCGGSVTPLLLSLVQSQPLSPNELEELRAVIEEQKRKAKGKH
jgi:BlaI family transcriptional regulator, penicillinase repressor